MLNIDSVLKRNNDDFVIYSNEYPIGYNVVPKSVDEANVFDIEEVRAWCAANPDKVKDEITETPDDVMVYIEFRDAIKADLQYLKDTDDVDYQLARHERGTQILSEEKLADCISKDKKRGEIADSIKARKSTLLGMLDALTVKYGRQVLINFGIRDIVG